MDFTSKVEPISIKEVFFMRVIALGVSSAFATGEYERGVTVQQTVDLVMKFVKSPKSKDIPRHVIAREVKKFSQRFYVPKWHSNFLIETSSPTRRMN